jgi:uncharacterized protein
MAVTLEEDLKELESDTECLHSNYKELINQYNQQFVAIRNRDIAASDKDLDGLKQKLRESGIKPGEVLVDYISDKRNQIV